MPSYRLRVIATSTPRHGKTQVCVAMAEKLEQILEIFP